jgi:hypothetical protein
MHFEAPKTPLRTLREFVGHFSMIVVSIITALVLEQWMESVHHARMAREASQQIEAELRANIDEIRACRKVNDGHLKLLEELRAMLIQDIRAKLSGAVIDQHMRVHSKDFGLHINTPSPHSEAWEVSVANQSASWMDPAIMRRYSSAYAALRDMRSWNSFRNLDAPRMVDVMIDFHLGVVDPRALLHVQNQMLSVTNHVQDNLGELEAEVAKALQAAPEVANKS